MSSSDKGVKLTKAQRDDATTQAGTEELCLACRFCTGPIVTMCMNPRSDFGMSFVHPAGWCPEFSMLENPTHD